MQKLYDRVLGAARPATVPRMGDEIPWYAPGHRREGIPRQRQRGEEVWRLRSADGQRVQHCELRDDTRVGAGWDVILHEDDEPLFSRRCPDETSARRVAEFMRQDIVRAGWEPAAQV